MTRQLRFYRRTDIWREGKWLDLWSVVHFLTGASFGLGVTVFHFGVPASIVIVFLLLTAYEMWEAMVGIQETPQNRIMDVVVGMTSFMPVFLLNDSRPFGFILAAFVPVLALNIALAWLGWRESQKAEELEIRLRHRFQAQRRRFLERRAKLRIMLPPERNV